MTINKNDAGSLKPSTKDERVGKKKRPTKTIKTVIFGIDNFDTIFGSTSYVLFVGMCSYFHQGYYLTSGLLAVLCLTAILIRIRVPQGKITRVLRTPVQDIKTKLQDAAKTIIRG